MRDKGPAFGRDGGGCSLKPIAAMFLLRDNCLLSRAMRTQYFNMAILKVDFCVWLS